MDDISVIVGRLRRVGSDLPVVEVKSASGGMPDTVAATMCAFANLPGGGLLLLGLDEGRAFEPVGLTDAAGLASGLSSMARSAFDPPLQISVDVETFEGTDIVVARIHELPLSMKPCVVRRTGQAYLRFFDGDYPLSRLEMDGFIANRTRPRFDEIEVDGATEADLDPALIDEFVATARRSDRRFATVADDRELLLRTGVLSVGGIPTVAGLLALGEHPQQFLPHCNIRAAVLPEGAATTTRALDSATFTGPLAAMLDDVVAWVALNSRRRLVANPTTGHVIDVLDPPAIAVRELVSNALVHRDLSDWASSRAIELRMTASTFRLTNPGGLYGISVAQLGVHPLTSARNRRLVEICKHLRTSDGNVVEALASGIPATLDSLRQAGMPEPEFFDQGLSFTVIIDRRDPTERRSPPASPPTLNQRLTPSENALLAVLDRALTVRELAERLDLTTNAVHKRLATLRSKGLVELDGGPGRETTYHQIRR